MQPLIVICGTTASGKSDLAVETALRTNGEIISADSRQVFRGLDIGSGKISPAEMRGVPHYGLDIAEPGSFFSVAQYQRLAYEWTDGILARGRLPILCGGTGLYVDAVADGYLLSSKAPDLSYRAYLDTLSTETLYEMLRTADHETQTDPRNRNRVMRCLEKIHDGDDAKPGKEPRYRVLRLGVTWDREIIRARIDERLDCRFQNGMVREIEGLLAQGVSRDFLIGLGLEYRFITQYVTGDIPDFEDMRAQLSHAIKRFALRQMTWFRRNKDIRWLDMTASPAEEAQALIHSFLHDTETDEGRQTP